MDILSLLEYKTAIQSVNPNEDDKLFFVIDFVNKFIPRYCNTSFGPTVVTEELSSRLGDAIMLPHAPVISVEALYSRSIDGTLTLIPNTSYRVNKEGGYINIVSYEPGISDRDYGVSVDYTHGHTLVPDDIKLAAIELVNTYKSKNFFSSKSGSGDTLTIMKASLLPLHIKTILDMYRVL